MKAFSCSGRFVHLDDDPLDCMVTPPYTPQEAAALAELIAACNAAFGAEADNPQAVNAGAWHALDLSGGGGFLANG